MRRVGIRELRQNASRYIRLVKAGETLEVTERDVPVALLTPLPVRRNEESRIEQMIREGLLIRGTQDWDNLKTLPSRPGEQPLTEVLDKLREDKV